MLWSRQRAAVSVVAFICWTSTASVAAAAGPCKNIPVRVTLYTHAVTNGATGESVPSALQSDGAGEYVDGASGSALIMICSGTNDAVVNLSRSKRKFKFVFAPPLAGSVVEEAPSWVPGTFLVTGWINVRHLTFSKDPFTTRVGSTFTGPDGAQYRLGFHPYDADAPDLHSPELAVMDNTPYLTSPAVVFPSYPPVCAPGTMPTWIVRGTSPNGGGLLQVATLHKKTRDGQIHHGQYSMPFELRIEAMQCFAY